MKVSGAKIVETIVSVFMIWFMRLPVLAMCASVTASH